MWLVWRVVQVAVIGTTSRLGPVAPASRFKCESRRETPPSEQVQPSHLRSADAPRTRYPPASLAIPQAEPRSLPPSQCELGTSYSLWSVSYCLHRAHAPRLSWTRSNSGRFSVTR